MANAIVRDGIWGLSLMAVHPAHHARGTGTRLLAATLAAAAGTRGQIIMSSQDPKAMRMYFKAGFDLHPAVGLAGILDRDAIPAGLRARASDDLEAAAATAAAVRGGAYAAEDLALISADAGRGLLAVDGRGFVVHLDGSPIVLVADDQEVATDLLWAAFAEAPRGGSVHVDCLTAGQDWAVLAGLSAGLALSPDGPLFTRGELGPLRPFVPSGAIL
jgi:hypothetical protein